MRCGSGAWEAHELAGGRAKPSGQVTFSGQWWKYTQRGSCRQRAAHSSAVRVARAAAGTSGVPATVVFGATTTTVAVGPSPTALKKASVAARGCGACAAAAAAAARRSSVEIMHVCGDEPPRGSRVCQTCDGPVTAGLLRAPSARLRLHLLGAWIMHEEAGRFARGKRTGQLPSSAHAAVLLHREVRWEAR